MTDVTDMDVRHVADTHRAALLRGDRELAGNAVETKLLHAIVTESALRAKAWVVTRVPNGGQVGDPLQQFAVEVAEQDSVGKAVRAIDEELFKQAKGVVVHAITTGTMPLWIGSVVGFVIGAIGFTYDAGFRIGVEVWTVLATGGSAVAVAVSRGLQYSGRAVAAVGDTAVRTMASARAIGAVAERIYTEETRPAVVELYGRLAVPPVLPTVLLRVRGFATTVVGAAWGLAAFATVVALFGILDGIDAAKPTTPY